MKIRPTGDSKYHGRKHQLYFMVNKGMSLKFISTAKRFQGLSSKETAMK